MKKPIEVVVEKLAGEVRPDPSGAKSLAHLLVVVPTAQSGRRLRLKLAEQLGAVIPPEIRLPQQLLLGEDLRRETEDERVEIAGRTDELVAFLEALGEKGTLDVAAQFSDIRGILGGNALAFSDVADRIGDILTDETADFEVERWKGFAELEERYFAALAKRGKTDRIVAMKKTIADPPRLEGVEKIVIAYVLDPIPAMRQVVETYKARDGVAVEEVRTLDGRRETGDGRRETGDGRRETGDARRETVLAMNQIVPCATAASEAEKVAEIFAAVKADEALPSLCVADAEEFPEIQGALQAKGLKVHDPSRTLLVTSSLGHLVEQVSALVRTRSYNVFSAFIRGGDARRWLCAELKISPEEYVDALNKLDNAQAKLLPEKIDDIGPKTSGKLRAIFEHVDVAIRKKGIRQILQSVFAAHILDERDPDAREFAAAAETVNALIDECLSNDRVPVNQTIKQSNNFPGTFCETA